MASERFLITGASGFLGRALATELSQTLPTSSQLYSLSLNACPMPRFQHFVCDLNNPKEVEKIIGEISPDYIFHLSGLSQVSQEIPFKNYFIANTLQTLNLLNALVTSKKNIRFLLASSIHVYGNQSGTVSEEASLKPESAYAFSKYLAEEAVKKHSKTFDNFHGVIVRLSTCLGPGQPTGFVASDFIEKVRLSEKNNESKISTGPLTGNRQFMDQRDVAKALALIMKKSQTIPTQIFNLASPVQTTIGELLQLILGLTRPSLKIESQTESPNSFRGLKINSTRFTSFFPGFSWRPLKETLRDMLKS